MKKLILVIAILFTTSVTFSQNFSSLENYKLNEAKDYKQAESKILECTNYMFNTPYDKNDINRLNATQFIIKWMTGTPHYTFNIDTKATDLTKGNADLLGYYFAAMSKVVIENKGDKLSDEQMYTDSESILLEFCFNKENNMKPTRKMKKIMKSRE